MTALTAPRLTDERDGTTFSVPLAANAKGYAGGIVVRNATGYGDKATTAVGLIAVGRAETNFDNTGGINGARSVEAKKGVFAYVADASLTVAHIGKQVFLGDDQTIYATDGSGTRSAPVTLVDLEGSVAWVRIGY